VGWNKGLVHFSHHWPDLVVAVSYVNYSLTLLVCYDMPLKKITWERMRAETYMGWMRVLLVGSQLSCWWSTTTVVLGRCLFGKCRDCNGGVVIHNAEVRLVYECVSFGFYQNVRQLCRGRRCFVGFFGFEQNGMVSVFFSFSFFQRKASVGVVFLRFFLPHLSCMKSTPIYRGWEEHEGSREHGLWLLIRLERISFVDHKQTTWFYKTKL